MTFDPFICDECWGEYGHRDHCPEAAPKADTTGEQGSSVARVDMTQEGASDGHCQSEGGGL